MKNVKRYRRALEKEGNTAEAAKFDFLPVSFVLPSEYSMFVEEFKRNPGSTFIAKPIGRAQGRGIFLFNRLSQISDWKKDAKWKADGQQQQESYIAQRYIDRPYLIGGKKSDVRLYVLVVNYSPLQIYLHRGGFARFSGFRYSNNDISNNFVHLTNVAIQKTHEDYVASAGCKWMLRDVRLYLESRHGSDAVAQLFYDIQMLIVRSLICVQKTIINQKNSFELYGYDILFDADLKPWLIEVNASPSLSAENKPDYDMKYGMLDDMVSVLNIEKDIGPLEEQVGGFDLIWNNGPVRNERTGAVNSFLGTFNDREANLKRIRKAWAIEQQKQKLREEQEAQQARASTTTSSRIRPGSRQ